MNDNQHRAPSRTPELVEASPPGPIPGGREPRATRAFESVWRPVIVKVASVAAGMLGLAGIGLFATLEANPNGTGALPPAWMANAGAEVTAQAAQLLPLALPQLAQQPGDPTPDSNPEASRTVSETTTPASEPPTSAGSTESPAAEPPNEPPAPEPPPARPPSGITPDGKVILNTANVEELERLPGIGKKRAEKILELRTKLGRFRKPTDLLRVRGIGVKSLQRMLPQLVVDPPTPEPPKDAPN